MENQKLSIYWTIKLIGQFAFILGFLYLIVFLIPKLQSVDTSIVWFKNIITLLFFLVSCMFACFMFETYNNEGKYVEHVMIPLKEFGLDIHDNLYVFSLNGTAWIVEKKYSKVLELKEIEVVKYYNKNRECIEVKPKLPYRMGV